MIERVGLVDQVFAGYLRDEKLDSAQSFGTNLDSVDSNHPMEHVREEKLEVSIVFKVDYILWRRIIGIRADYMALLLSSASTEVI